MKQKIQFLLKPIALFILGLGFYSIPIMAEEEETSEVIVEKVQDETSTEVVDETTNVEQVQTDAQQEEIMGVNEETVESSTTTTENKRVEGFRLLLSDELNKELNGENALYPTTERRELGYVELSHLTYKDNQYIDGSYHYTFADSAYNAQPDWIISRQLIEPIVDDYDEFFDGWRLIHYKYVGTETILHNGEYEYISHNYVAQYDKLIRTLYWIGNSTERKDYRDDGYWNVGNVYKATNYNGEFVEEKEHLNAPIVPSIDGLVFSHWEKKYGGWNYNNTAQYEARYKVVNGIMKSKSGEWKYFKNGYFEKYTGIAQSIADNNWYFVRNGVLDWNYTGIAQSVADGNWYFTRKGKVDWAFTGVAQSIANKDWYHCNKGKVDWNFTGISRSVADGNWYFSRKGKLDWNFTGVAQSIADKNWYYCNKGKVNWNFTGISQSVANGKWYFTRKGKLDWGYTGIANSIANGKWYFVRNGELDWNFTGVAQSIANGKWYSINNGELNWKANGLYKSVVNGKYYVVKNGQLNWGYNGRYYDPITRRYYNIRKGQLV